MLRALRHRDFRLLWSAQAVSLGGDGIYLVAIAWLVYDISNRPGALAIVGFAWTLPQVAGLLLAGVLSDRFERRRLLVIADLVRCVAIGAIAALAYAGTAKIWHLVLLVMVYGLGQALFQPAYTAIVPEIVPREELLQANALREVLEPLGMRFAGPALGGVLIALFGVGTAFLIDAVTFAVSALLVIGISARPPPRAEAGSMRRDLAEGFAYVRAHAWLWGTLVGAAMFLLFTFGPFEVLLPYVIRNDLGGDAATFGTVLAAGGLGSFFGAILIGRTGLPRRHITFMWGAWCAGDLLFVGLAVAQDAWVMCALAFVSFALATSALVVWNTLMNTLVPPELLGRVSSFDWFVSIGLTPLSFALTGPVASVIGARETLAAAGLLGTATFVFVFIPGVRAPEQERLAS
ncbi:MAG TPA: MFS transporter [Thermoleophilaceae bacterium]|nr:MFS transporter [Thermoleophilaceae bacterium]